MHGPAAAEGHHREIPRVIAAPHGDELQGIVHVRVRHTDDALGRALVIRAQRRADLPAQGRAHGVQVDLHVEVLRRKPARYQVRVRRRRLRAALAVGHRAGQRARALGADLERACLVYPRYRAAAVAYLHNVHDRGHDGIARVALVLFDIIRGRDLDLTVVYERAFRRRAADVEGDDVPLAYELAQYRRAEHARHRAGLHDVDGRQLRLLKGSRTAVALHYIPCAGDLVLVQPRAQPVDIRRGRGHDIGVERRRGRALVLAPFLCYVNRWAHKDLRPELLDIGCGLSLVRLVGVAVYEADGNGLDALLLEVLDRLLYVLAAEGRYDLSVVGDALRDLAAQIARNKGHGLFKDHVEQVGPVAAGELEHVAEALCGQQRRLRALALRQGIYDRGSTMEKGCYALWLYPAFFEHVHDALLEIRRCGMGLFLHETSVLAYGDEIGECASDVGCNSHIAGYLHFLAALCKHYSA